MLGTVRLSSKPIATIKTLSLNFLLGKTILIITDLIYRVLEVERLNSKLSVLVIPLYLRLTPLLVYPTYLISYIYIH